MKNKILFFLLGPTCVGKTYLSLKLFDYFPFEIINIDSSMVYKFMNIGTGKPDFNVRNKIKHHLIDIRHPMENYSVYDFCLDSYYGIIDCFSRNKIPLFVGGTMMYAWYFQNFINDKIKLSFISEKFSLNDFLYFKYSNISFVNIFLLPFDKDIFYSKIKNRIWEMLDCGFLDEVNFLKLKLKLNVNFNFIRSIGYKDLFCYLNGEISFSDSINSILKSTFRLADSQLKWIKKFSANSFFIENKEKFFLKKCSEIVNLYL
jgi:tRNA dimethylallyltransferase